MISRTARWLVRFGYDGRDFHGWARQPGLRTVEGEILRGAQRRGIFAQPGPANVQIASRTDRGVSARANAFALTTNLPGPAILRALNGIAPDLFFSAATPVTAEFSPRSAAQRWYRYVEPAATAAVHNRWSELAKEFVGPIDARTFGRGIPSEHASFRTIDSVRVANRGDVMLVDVRARSFVWGMVRKIVSAMRLCVEGGLSVPRLRSAIAGRERLTLPLAPPDRLVLWEVVYDLPWTVWAKRPTRRQSIRNLSERDLTLTREFILVEAWREYFTHGMPAALKPPA